MLKDIDQAIEEDTQAPDSEDLKEINSKELEEKIAALNERLTKPNKKQQKGLKKLKEEALPKLQEYERHLEILGDRNSYSKTDTDATFMRMKEDHMKNGQLKPAYNVQISTEEQFLTNFSLHQRPGDTATLEPHLEQFKDLYEKQSDTVVADAGYGSEQNYEYAENESIKAYIKYNYFHAEQKKKYKQNPFLPANLYYNAEQGFLVCPIGQKMYCIGTQKRTSDLGYDSTVHIYQAQNCKGCPMRSGCHKSEGNRKIELNHRLLKYRKQAREKLMSEEGLYHRSKRPIEPEAVFGQIKFNNKFNRFSLRGLAKVEIEFGLIAISHNLRKIAQIVSKNLNINGYQQILGFFQQILTGLAIITNSIKSNTKICIVKFDSMKIAA